MAPGYLFFQMDDTDVGKITSWRYDPPYDFYNWDADPEDLAELRDPERRRNVYFSVRDKNLQLVGFFQFEEKDSIVDVGLGLRPDLTGQGYGLEFLLSGLEFAKGRFGPVRFTLSVATFNDRAIVVYERAGFRRGDVFMHDTNGGEHEFLSMWREA